MPVTREDGFVLCCHGRKMMCEECAREYEDELDGPAGESCGTLIAATSQSGLTRQVPDESPGATHYFDAVLAEMKGMSLIWMADAIEQYAEWCGSMHDDICPEDDTCNCSLKWVNDGVNSTARFLRALAAEGK